MSRLAVGVEVAVGVGVGVGACINSRIRLSLGAGRTPELCGLELHQSRVHELQL